MSRVLAVDVGTTAVKVALVVDGEVLAAAERDHPLHHPHPGWAEQDPNDWWRGFLDALSALRAELGAGMLDDAGAIDAIGVTGQMQDLIPVDAAGEPVRPAILYADGRAAAEHAELEAELGDAWADAVGSEPDATTVPAKWRWLRRHEPDAAAATAVTLFGGNGFLVHRLTGFAACDPTCAATTALLDLGTLGWWAPAVDADTLPPPTPVSAVAVTGTVTAAAAAETGLAEGTPVVLAAGDVGATTLGVVGTELGRPYAYLGTSGWVAVVTAGVERAPGVIVLAGAQPGTWISAAPIITGGGAIDWARAELLGGIDHDAFEALAADGFGAGEGVLFLPHLDGVRIPVADPTATGVLVGVRRSTTAATIAAAVVEGVAQAVVELVDTVVPGAADLALCGGVTRSATTVQVVADVAGRPVHVVPDVHATVLGAAVCAELALGAPTGSVAGAGAVVEPRPDRAAIHDRTGRLFRQLAPTMSRLSAELASVRDGGRSARQQEG